MVWIKKFDGSKKCKMIFKMEGIEKKNPMD